MPVWLAIRATPLGAVTCRLPPESQATRMQLLPATERMERSPALTS